jgi:hypothetical protein
MVNSPRRISFKDLRTAVLSLSQRQAELRQKLETYLAATGKSVGTVGREAGTTWASVRRFLDGHQALMSGNGLGGLAKVLSSEELGEQILELGEAIPDRYIGLVHFNEDVVTIVCDLLEAWGSQPSEYTMAEFAAAFSEQEQVVFGALQCSREALNTLRDHPPIVQLILEKLVGDEFELALKEAKKSRVRQKLVKVEEIERLVRTLLPQYDNKVSLVRDLGFSRGSLDRTKLIGASETQLNLFVTRLNEALHTAEMTDGAATNWKALYDRLYNRLGSQRQVAEALGVASSTLSDAIHGKSSPETVQGLLKRGAELESGSGPNEPNTALRLGPLPRAVDSVDPHDPFHGLAGTEQEGTPYVLTSANLQEITSLPVSALISSFVTSARVTRGFLNLLAQLKGEEVRTAMQHSQVRRELEELYVSLELASTTHPSALVEIFAAQREQWAAMNQSTSTDRG